MNLKKCASSVCDLRFGKRFPAVAFIFLCLLLTGTCPVQAVGFRLPNQDPEAIARGDAFAATADNPSAIYYNPAGIGQLDGTQIRLGLYAISPSSEFTSAAGAHAKTDTTFQAVPQVYLATSFTNAPISVGLGVYAPYGLSLDWGRQTPFNTLAENGKVLYVSINPVIAWRVTPQLTIAAGPTINYSEASFQQALDPSGATQFRFAGHDTGYGFNAGILWRPHPKWSFGVNYRSETRLTYEGSASQTLGAPFPATTSANAEIVFPQFVVGGVSFRPNEKWNFEFDLDWTDWASAKSLILKNTPFGTVPLTLNYRSGLIYDFGVTRQLGKGYFASCGYIFAQNSSPDANFTPLIPDANLHLGSVGFGHRGIHWDWAFAYHFAYNGERVVKNDANGLANGTYQTFNNAVNFAVTYKF